VNRKDVIINLLAIPAIAGAVVGTFGEASAAASVDQKTAQYQGKPKSGHQCSGCSLYIPAKSNPSKSNGTCKVVKGAISPQGWCKFYAPAAK
jgi:hypothetical protein